MKKVRAEFLVVEVIVVGKVRLVRHLFAFSIPLRAVERLAARRRSGASTDTNELTKINGGNAKTAAGKKPERRTHSQALASLAVFRDEEGRRPRK